MIVKKGGIKNNSTSLSIISGNIANLYEEGIPLLIIMDLICELPITIAYKNSIITVKDNIMNGYDLGEAFNIHTELYPKFFISMISIGEKSGKLPDVLKALEKYYEKISFLRKKIIAVSTYPLILFTLVIILAIFILLFLIPNFYNVYLSLEIDPPKYYLAIYSIVELFKESPIKGAIYFFSYAIIIFSAISIIGINYIRNRQRFNLPIIEDINEYIIMLILHIIVKSGVNISSGLTLAIDSFGQGVIRNRLEFINLNILEGKTISDSFELVGNISRYSISLIKLGEESGSLEKRLLVSIQYLEERIVSKINKGLKTLEPLMIIFMAFLVVVFIVIFVLPLFDSLLGGFSY